MAAEGQTLKIMSELQSMHENDLTRQIVIPLLEHLGFHQVEYYGGNNEKGKDILCWAKDRIGDISLVVAQVKHFKLKNDAKDSKGLQTVVNQITTCFKKTLIYTDKSEHLPGEVYLISTFPIDTKTLETRFGKQPDLHDQKIKIIDGIKLANLISQHAPHLLKDIVGAEFTITSVLNETLNNEVLLKALGYSNKKDLKNIYTDIDFSLGKITTELFFNSSFSPLHSTIKLPESEWSHFKSVCSEVEKEFGLQFLNKKLSSIESEYRQNLLNYDSWTKQIAELHNSLSEHVSRRTAGIKMLDELNEKGLTYFKEISELQKEIKLIDEEILKANDQIGNLNKLDPSFYNININGYVIVVELQLRRKWIEDSVTQFNLTSPSVQETKAFIEKCKSIIDAASHFFINKNYFLCIGYETKKIVRNNFETTRFKMPIQQVFDTGLNLTVLGEAGAGKSTSLQMYALNSKQNLHKLIICVPLANVTQNWVREEPDLPDIVKMRNLDQGISKYLGTKGIDISFHQFSSEIANKETVLLLDGIDEAIKLNPWLPKSLKYLSEKYGSKLQIIVTSRMSGSYLEELPFFAITLLPFTDSQRDIFIEKWFGPEESKKIINVKNHLRDNKAIGEIVKNPLLTTTLCVLAQKDIALPNTELNLYNDRLLLLTGYYDRVKNIDNRISSKPSVLEKIAQKIAYYLHADGKREEDKEVLKNRAVHKTLNTLSIAEAEIAVEELIDPCNILLPMTEDGKFGFGHLRYQEHLVAKELISNRSIDIYPLLKQYWWRGSLTLFAKMDNDLQWLIKDIGERVNMNPVKEALSEMIRKRPKTEQKNLIGLMNSYIKLEEDADDNFEFDDYDQ